MSFYDEHLKGVEPQVEQPSFLVQDNEGEWRGQDTWPEVDRTVTVRLEREDYVDDGGESAGARTLTADAQGWDTENAPDPVLQPRAQQRLAAAAPEEDGYTSWSTPVRHDTRITGTPRIALDADVSGAEEANVLVRMWDVAPDGTAVVFDEQMSLVGDGGAGFELKSADWTLAAGHQLAVQIGTNTTGSWADRPTGATVEVTRARLELDLQGTADDQPAEGARAPYLDSYLRAYTEQWETERGTFPLTVER